MDPFVVSALTPQIWFVLGRTSCGTRSCAALVRTTDGGRSFTRMPVPAVSAGALQNATVVFADRRDGYVVAQARAYVTHDGGARWRNLRLPGGVRSIAVGGGAVYAVVSGRSASEVLLRSPAGRDHFDRLPLRLTRMTGKEGFGLSVAAAGRLVFALASADGGGAGGLLVSRDGGSGFRPVSSGPGCIAGTIAAEGARTLWTQCVTGTMSWVGRSTDAGRTFTSTVLMDLCNCAVLGVVSPGAAVVGANPTAQLELLTDGGRRAEAVGPPPDPNGYFWSSIQFAGPRVGLVVRYSESERRPNQLWRTTDGGQHWSLVHVKRVEPADHARADSPPSIRREG